MKNSARFIVALLLVMLITMFLLFNVGHQAQLRLFSEIQVGSLTLLGVGFFAGAASVYLVGLWRHWKKDTHTTVSRSARNSVPDKDL